VRGTIRVRKREKKRSGKSLIDPAATGAVKTFWICVAVIGGHGFPKEGRCSF